MAWDQRRIIKVYPQDLEQWRILKKRIQKVFNIEKMLSDSEAFNILLQEKNEIYIDENIIKIKKIKRKLHII